MGAGDTVGRRRIVAGAYLVGGSIGGGVLAAAAVTAGPGMRARATGDVFCAGGMVLLGISLSMMTANRSGETPRGGAEIDVATRRQTLDQVLGRRPHRASDVATMRTVAQDVLLRQRGQLPGVLGTTAILVGLIVSLRSGSSAVLVTAGMLLVVSWAAHLSARLRARRAREFLYGSRVPTEQPARTSYGPEMSTSVAVLSDIHGVLPVLESILSEPDVMSADRIVVCGDHAAGPMPVEVLDRLVGLGPRAILVRGNADRELVEISRGGPSEHPESVWAAGCLRPDQVALLAGLPHPVVLTVAGFGPVVFCHGTPRDDEEVVLVDTRLERWAEALAGLPPEVRTVVCGHTHMPFTRLVDRRLVVNPGSVGMPYGRPGGSWVLLRDGQVELRHTEVDIEEALAVVVARSTYPERRTWAEEYLGASHSDADALRSFGPRDGR